MLTKIKIKNFRLFESLEVKRLGRVTLLVGKNNSGKSSFLEALLLYLNMPGEGAKNVVHYLLDKRQELGSYLGEEEQQSFLDFTSSDSPFENLFLGRKYRDIPIVIYDMEELTISLQRRETEVRVGSTNAVVSLMNLVGETEFGSSVIPPTIQGTAQLDIRKKSGAVSRFIPTIGLSDRQAAVLWDLITLTDVENVIISVLSIIDENIRGVRFVVIDRRRIPIVKIETIQQPVPLRSLGDGVTKLFHILISIANAKDGTLLIDEFENGFHWSVQEKVWTAVFELAEKLNVQVFATTHSRDCIQAFSQVWSNNEEDGAFIRLENNEGVVRAQEYTAELLSDSIETRVEVR